MQRAVIIHNPAARNAPSAGRLRRAAQELRPLGWEVEVRPTAAAGHAAVLAREAAAEAAVVFACGGDGTINEVANGLVGSGSALGVLRGGMGDVFGKEVGIPRRPEAAIRLLLQGERRRFDLGTVRGPSVAALPPAGGSPERGCRYFLLLAGVGFDAEVVRRVPPGPKRLLGTASYVLWGLRELARYRPLPAHVRLDAGDERVVDLFWLLLGNTRSYGGVIDITARAVVDDGLLDAYVFAGRGLGWAIATGLRIALRRQDGARGVWSGRVAELAVTTAGLPLQADGEFFGETPATFGVAAAALDVLVPKGGADHLFAARA